MGRTWGTVWYSSARSINVCERMDEPWRLPAEVMCRVQREKTWYSGQRGCILWELYTKVAKTIDIYATLR